MIPNFLPFIDKTIKALRQTTKELTMDGMIRMLKLCQLKKVCASYDIPAKRRYFMVTSVKMLCHCHDKAILLCGTQNGYLKSDKK
jgi:hypothetical protein